MIGPNGETPSWTFSHAFNVGAFGGFDGFQGTVVVFTSESRGPDGFAPLTDGNKENDVGEGLIGPFLVSG